MKQSYFPPTVKEPQDQLLCSSTAEVTPPSSVLLCLLSQMTWFVFLIKPLIVHLHSEYCNYRLDGLSSDRRNGRCRCRCRSRTVHAFQVEGNNTILFPKEGDLARWAESIETAVSIELRKHTSKERFEKKKMAFHSGTSSPQRFKARLRESCK